MEPCVLIVVITLWSKLASILRNVGSHATPTFGVHTPTFVLQNKWTIVGRLLGCSNHATCT